jgi:hypothetical protein
MSDIASCLRSLFNFNGKSVPITFREGQVVHEISRRDVANVAKVRSVEHRDSDGTRYDTMETPLAAIVHEIQTASQSARLLLSRGHPPTAFYGFFLTGVDMAKCKAVLSPTAAFEDGGIVTAVWILTAPAKLRMLPRHKYAAILTDLATRVGGTVNRDAAWMPVPGTGATILIDSGPRHDLTAFDFTRCETKRILATWGNSGHLPGVTNPRWPDRVLARDAHSYFRQASSLATATNERLAMILKSLGFISRPWSHSRAWLAPDLATFRQNVDAAYGGPIQWDTEVISWRCPTPATQNIVEQASETIAG